MGACNFLAVALPEEARDLLDARAASKKPPSKATCEEPSEPSDYGGPVVQAPPKSEERDPAEEDSVEAATQSQLQQGATQGL